MSARIKSYGYVVTYIIYEIGNEYLVKPHNSYTTAIPTNNVGISDFALFVFLFFLSWANIFIFRSVINLLRYVQRYAYLYIYLQF